MLPKPCGLPGFDAAVDFAVGWSFAAVSGNSEGRGFPASWDFAVGMDLTGGLEFTVDVENALGIAGYPN